MSSVLFDVFHQDHVRDYVIQKLSHGKSAGIARKWKLKDFILDFPSADELAEFNACWSISTRSSLLMPHNLHIDSRYTLRKSPWNQEALKILCHGYVTDIGGDVEDEEEVQRVEDRLKKIFATLHKEYSNYLRDPTELETQKLDAMRQRRNNVSTCHFLNHQSADSCASSTDAGLTHYARSHSMKVAIRSRGSMFSLRI